MTADENKCHLTTYNAWSYIYIYIYISLYLFVRSLTPLSFMFAYCGWAFFTVHGLVLTPLKTLVSCAKYFLIQTLFSASLITEGQTDSFLLGLGLDCGKKELEDNF